MAKVSVAGLTPPVAADFGTWQTPWGDINRYQRLTGDIDLIPLQEAL